MNDSQQFEHGLATGKVMMDVSPWWWLGFWQGQALGAYRQWLRAAGANGSE